MDGLAWTLAAGSDPKARNPQTSLIIALKVCELTHFPQPMFLCTLAAAYAQNGRQSLARETVEKARKLALSAGRPEIAGEIEKRMQSFIK
jgi:hypothetical protein